MGGCLCTVEFWKPPPWIGCVRIQLSRTAQRWQTFSYVRLICNFSDTVTLAFSARSACLCIFSKPPLFSGNSVWFHHCLLWFVCSPSYYWSPDFNPNTSLMLPDISDPASKWVEQIAESDDWCPCGSERLPRKCQRSLNYAWSDKWSCFVDISACSYFDFLFSHPTQIPSRFLQGNFCTPKMMFFKIAQICECVFVKPIWLTSTGIQLECIIDRIPVLQQKLHPLQWQQPVRDTFL